MSAEPLPILAAEDEENDAFILRLAFKKAGINNPLIVVGDGQEAIDYLAGSPPFQDRTTHPLPALIILDLKMPRMSGFDVLAWLSERQEYKGVPVIMLSSSPAESDIQKARELGAKDYFVKPVEIASYGRIVEALQSHWLS